MLCVLSLLTTAFFPQYYYAATSPPPSLLGDKQNIFTQDFSAPETEITLQDQAKLDESIQQLPESTTQDLEGDSGGMDIGMPEEDRESKPVITTEDEGGEENALLDLNRGSTPLQDEPMDLATPIDSDTELKFDVQEPPESETKAENEEDSALGGIKLEIAEVEEGSVDEEELEDKVAKESEGAKAEGGRLDRLDSVQIDPSYQPESEELLYEGDIEDEPETKSEAKREEKREEEISEKKDVFLLDEDIVAVHSDTMEIDDTPKVQQEEEKKEGEKAKETAPESKSQEKKDPSQQSSNSPRKPTESTRFVPLSLSFLSTGMQHLGAPHSHTSCCAQINMIAGWLRLQSSRVIFLSLREFPL